MIRSTHPTVPPFKPEDLPQTARPETWVTLETASDALYRDILKWREDGNPYPPDLVRAHAAIREHIQLRKTGG